MKTLVFTLLVCSLVVTSALPPGASLALFAVLMLLMPAEPAPAASPAAGPRLTEVELGEREAMTVGDRLLLVSLPDPDRTRTSLMYIDGEPLTVTICRGEAGPARYRLAHDAYVTGYPLSPQPN